MCEAGMCVFQKSVNVIYDLSVSSIIRGSPQDKNVSLLTSSCVTFWQFKGPGALSPNSYLHEIWWN